ncbi:hypothetical protein DRQ33_01670 [bacterium]|nr:MAG: hypothetical protein DRQ33_01670 [bacterium]
MNIKYISASILIFLVLMLLFYGCAERSLPSDMDYNVILEFPDDGDTLNNSRAYLDWEYYSDANGYKILLWREDSIIWEQIEFNSSVKTLFPLTDGFYRWCVGVRIGDGDFGNWSDTSSFTINQRPFEINSFVNTPGTARDVTSIDNYLYVADGQAGMSLVNAEFIFQLEFLNNYDWDGQYEARGIFAEPIANILAIADYRGVPPIYFFDITDRLNPTSAVSGVWARLCEDVCGIWMRDTLFILAADRDDGMYIYDLGTPGYVNQRGSAYPAPAFCNGVSARDTIAAVCVDDVGVLILNIADPDNKVLLGSCDTPGKATRCIFYDDYLYVADGICGLGVIDITDLENPAYIYNSDVQVGDAQDLIIAEFDGNSYLALAIGSEGVLFYSLENPAMPYLIGQIESMYAYGVGADERAFYIADRDWGILAVSLE